MASMYDDCTNEELRALAAFTIDVSRLGDRVRASAELILLEMADAQCARKLYAAFANAASVEFHRSSDRQRPYQVLLLYPECRADMWSAEAVAECPLLQCVEVSLASVAHDGSPPD